MTLLITNTITIILLESPVDLMGRLLVINSMVKETEQYIRSLGYEDVNTPIWKKGELMVIFHLNRLVLHTQNGFIVIDDDRYKDFTPIMNIHQPNAQAYEWRVGKGEVQYDVLSNDEVMEIVKQLVETQ